MRQRYGSTQVCEYRLTQAEVDALVLENVAKRCDPSYDFAHPVLLRERGERQPADAPLDYVIRFIQRAVAQDGRERDHVNFKPLAT